MRFLIGRLAVTAYKPDIMTLEKSDGGGIL